VGRDVITKIGVYLPYFIQKVPSPVVRERDELFSNVVDSILLRGLEGKCIENAGDQGDRIVEMLLDVELRPVIWFLEILIADLIDGDKQVLKSCAKSS